jgi:PilZ domain-containing protein
MDNRRNRPRHRAQKTGIITFHRDHALHGNGTNCRVRDLSPTGARLEVASQIGIPDEFTLWIEFDQIKVPCQVIWRTATRLGVAFHTKSQPARAGASLATSVLSQTPQAL